MNEDDLAREEDMINRILEEQFFLDIRDTKSHVLRMNQGVFDLLTAFAKDRDIFELKEPYKFDGFLVEITDSVEEFSWV